MEMSNALNEGSNENNLINIIKGIAIFLVIYGHALQYGNGKNFLETGIYWDDMTMKIIYSFHMPLFMSISGYLFWFSTKRHGIYKSVQSRIFRFIPVIATWGIILYLIDIMNGKGGNIKRLIYYFITDFWFLWAILVCSTAIFMIEKFMQLSNGINVFMKGGGILVSYLSYWEYCFSCFYPIVMD